MLQKWKCPNCKREFAKIKQTHSCKKFPLKKHFENKNQARKLFDYFVAEINDKVGKIKIESLPCCVHLVSNYTFGAVWALKDGIRIDFRLDHPINTKRVHKLNQMSRNRYLYFIDLKEKNEIDEELLCFIKESYHLNN